MKTENMHSHSGIWGVVILAMDYLTLILTSMGAMSFLGPLESVLHIVLYVMTIVLTGFKAWDWLSAKFKPSKNESTR